MTDAVVPDGIAAPLVTGLGWPSPAPIEAAVRAYALAEKAAATRRAYHTDFSLFSAWCRDRARTGGDLLGGAG